MSDVIELRELRVSAIVGVLAHEREREQPLEIDIDVERSFEEAALHDDLAATTDYAAVLRVATRPLMVAEIADIMIEERGLTDISVEDRDRMRNSVYCWLRDNDGKLVTKQGRYPSRWDLIR